MLPRLETLRNLFCYFKKEHCKRNTNVQLKVKGDMGVRVSVMDSLSLLEYAQAKEELCKNERNNCSKYAEEIKAARIVLEEKIIPLLVLWSLAFTGNKCDSEKAQRRILQLPLLSITWNSQVYIAENNTINASLNGKSCQIPSS